MFKIRDFLGSFGFTSKKIKQILESDSENKLRELLNEENTITESKNQN